jgi:hypothetical protein
LEYSVFNTKHFESIYTSLIYSLHKLRSKCSEMEEIECVAQLLKEILGSLFTALIRNLKTLNYKVSPEKSQNFSLLTIYSFFTIFDTNLVNINFKCHAPANPTEQPEESLSDWIYMGFTESKIHDYSGRVSDPSNVYLTFRLLAGIDDSVGQGPKKWILKDVFYQILGMLNIYYEYEKIEDVLQEINEGYPNIKLELLHRHTIYKNKIKLFKILIIYLIFGVEYTIETKDLEYFIITLNLYKKIFLSILLLAESERANLKQKKNRAIDSYLIYML